MKNNRRFLQVLFQLHALQLEEKVGYTLTVDLAYLDFSRVIHASLFKHGDSKLLAIVTYWEDRSVRRGEDEKELAEFLRIAISAFNNQNK